MKREVEELKAQKEDLRTESEERYRVHGAAIAEIQNKNHNTVGYQDRAKRCSHALDAMLEARTSRDVLIDVIRDLIANITQ